MRPGGSARPEATYSGVRGGAGWALGHRGRGVGHCDSDISPAGRPLALLSPLGCLRARGRRGAPAPMSGWGLAVAGGGAGWALGQGRGRRYLAVHAANPGPGRLDGAYGLPAGVAAITLA